MKILKELEERISKTEEERAPLLENLRTLHEEILVEKRYSSTWMDRYDPIVKRVYYLNGKLESYYEISIFLIYQ